MPDPSRWITPLLLGSNAALFAVHLAVTPTAEIVFREPFVVPREANRPLIYITWHRFNYVCMPMLRSLPSESRPTVIVHDGLASRAFSHYSSVWMGFEAFMFRRRSPVSARDQISEYVRRTGRPNPESARLRRTVRRRQARDSRGRARVQRTARSVPGRREAGGRARQEAEARRAAAVLSDRRATRCSARGQREPRSVPACA